MKNVFKILAVGLLSVCTLTSCNPDKKYTVTEAEWKALAEINNFTVEYYENDTLIVTEKYTEDTIQYGESYIIFEEDKQYFVSQYKDYGLVATDCTYLGYELGKLFVEYEYSDFEYDKESKTYVNSVPCKDGGFDSIKFENGLPVSATCTYIDESTTPATVDTYVSLYKDIRKTTITVPDFLYESELDNPYVYTVDEETWNSYRDVTNYDAYYYVDSDDLFETYIVSVDGNKMLFEDQLYIYEDGRTYLLEEKDSKWIATETELIDSWCFIDYFFSALDFSDFTYDEVRRQYRHSVNDGQITYTVFFLDGVLEGYNIELIKDNGKEYYVSFKFDNYNNVTVEVPDYSNISGLKPSDPYNKRSVLVDYSVALDRAEEKVYKYDYYYYIQFALGKESDYTLLEAAEYIYSKAPGYFLTVDEPEEATNLDGSKVGYALLVTKDNDIAVEISTLIEDGTIYVILFSYDGDDFVPNAEIYTPVAIIEEYCKLLNVPTTDIQVEADIYYYFYVSLGKDVSLLEGCKYVTDLSMEYLELYVEPYEDNWVDGDKGAFSYLRINSLDIYVSIGAYNDNGECVVQIIVNEIEE